MSDNDDYPPASRPDWLKTFAHVKGVLSSAPLDLPDRLDQAVGALKAAGWTVVVRSVGTDFAGPLGIPIPKDQPLDVLINKADPYTLDDAQTALSQTLNLLNVNYSALSAWAGEIVTEVVEPTIADVKKDVSSSLPWVLGGIGLGLVLLIAIKR
jgi:hypothetical protein